jgi:hypothetical protein
MRRDGVPIPFMVETLLPTTPNPNARVTFQEDHAEGGFLAELLQRKSSEGSDRVRKRSPARTRK